jgi:hypothetical protein
MAKKKVPTKTLINKILRESALNPKDRGPLQLVIDEHLTNPTYLEEKARELIKEATFTMSQASWNEQHKVYVERMQKAIFFAAAARCVRELMVING